MQEIKTKGIILNTRDFGEADKIATLFSIDLGKIAVKFNGVRKEKAKLKALIQPFTFIEAECFKRGDFYTIKTGSVINNFPKIVSDYSKTICAYILLEIISKILPNNKAENEIFLLSVATLDKIEKSGHYQALIEFIINFELLLGEQLNLFATNDRVYLDKMVGDFTPTRNSTCIEIDKKVFNALIEPTDNESIQKTCLKLLNTILKLKYDVEINSFSFL